MNRTLNKLVPNNATYTKFHLGLIVHVFAKAQTMVAVADAGKSENPMRKVELFVVIIDLALV